MCTSQQTELPPHLTVAREELETREEIANLMTRVELADQLTWAETEDQGGADGSGDLGEDENQGGAAGSVRQPWQSRRPPQRHSSEQKSLSSRSIVVMARSSLMKH